MTDIRHYLSAVHIALDLPGPRRSRDQMPYFYLLEQRSHVAVASIDERDYTSEGDHILHQIAELESVTYQHGDSFLR